MVRPLVLVLVVLIPPAVMILPAPTLLVIRGRYPGDLREVASRQTEAREDDEENHFLIQSCANIKDKVRTVWRVSPALFYNVPETVK